MSRNYNRPNELEKMAISFGRSPSEIEAALHMYDRVVHYARQTPSTASDLLNTFLNYCAMTAGDVPQHKLIYVDTRVIHVNESPLRPDPSEPIGKYNPEPSNYVFIGRPSKWGNPYIIGVDGGREECIRKFENYLLSNKILMQSLPELVGKTLGCFCKPLPCHGDILVKMVKKYVRIKTT